MNIYIPGLLKAEELATVKSLIADSTFEDGRKTASMAAKKVKNNEQLDAEAENSQKVREIVLNAMQDSPLLQQAFLPKKIYPPIVSRYTEGMEYGWHVDGPVMGEDKVRTDLAMTLFLNDPETYEGGELILQNPSGSLQYKLPAGDAIVYPATQLHCVQKITKGERLAVVTWFQSLVRNSSHRELLFQITQIIASLNQKENAAMEADSLMQIYSNLQRMWVES